MKKDSNVQHKISIYMDFGAVFEYEVTGLAKAREHASAIVMTGYRHTPADGTDDLEWYPPNRVIKVKITGGGESSSYRDHSRAT